MAASSHARIPALGFVLLTPTAPGGFFPPAIIEGDVKNESDGSSYDQAQGVKGPKLIMNLAWGCTLFFVIMLVGVMVIGRYFGGVIRHNHDTALAAAEQKRAQQSGSQPAPTAPPQTSSTGAPSN